MTKEKVAVIGLGKVGTALAFLLRKAGYDLVAVADRFDAAVRAARPFIGEAPEAEPSSAARSGELVVLAVNDDEIAPLCRELASSGAFGPSQKVVHLSGAGPLGLLAPAREAGAKVASIHPLQSFADVAGAVANLPGSTFGITCDEDLRPWAEGLVRDLGGTPFFVRDDDKALYHAAACIACNYLTALLDMAQEIYCGLGIPRERAVAAFWPLILGTLKNIEAAGTAGALTGPIARGDVSTVKRHLAILMDKHPPYLGAYREMGLVTTELAVRKGTLTAGGAEKLRRILKGEEE